MNFHFFVCEPWLILDKFSEPWITYNFAVVWYGEKTSAQQYTWYVHIGMFLKFDREVYEQYADKKSHLKY